MQPSHQTPKVADVQALLEQSTVFSVLDKKGHKELIKAFEWFYAVAGEAVVRPGTPGDYVYFVFHGRLKVFVDLDQSGTFDDDEVVAELGRGGVLGHLESCQNSDFNCMAQAIRDTELGRISREVFSQIANDYPQIWKSIANDSINQLKRSQSIEQNMADTHYITLMPLERFVEIADFASDLRDEMNVLSPSIFINKTTFNKALGDEAADDDIDVWDETDRKTVGWLTEQEHNHQFLMFQADSSASPWTRRCLRSADRILFVAHGGSKQMVREVESQIVQQKMMSRWAKRELILLYDEKVDLPSQTREWLVLRPWIDQVHHVKPKNPEDVKRLARSLTRQAVGLVLGGGGARGCAHIGVIQALRELNIPIDYVAGTSAGAGIAAQVAHHWDNSRMEKETWSGFVEMAPFQAYDIPYHSFMRKERVKAPAAELYGETLIEDLWLPFFCVSCDLSSNQKVVHTRGRLWKALRATTALPGVLPPVVLAGRFLIDGGVVDNEPIEDMKKINPGPCILVSLSGESENFLGDNVIDIPSNFSVIRSIIHPLLEPIQVPNVLSVIIQTMTISSAGKSVSELADLYITPDTRGYSLVDFKAMDELIPIGYNATMQTMERYANDATFLAKFGLKIGDIPESLPRIEVPRWKSLARERLQLRYTMLYQALMVFSLCGILVSGVQFLVYGNTNAASTIAVSAVVAGFSIAQGMTLWYNKHREAKSLQSSQPPVSK